MLSRRGEPFSTSYLGQSYKAYVTPARFHRLGRNPAGELASGRIAMARLEIARLDNDPNAPENGRLRFDVHTSS